MFPRGYAPAYEGGRRLEIVNLDPSDLKAAMLLVDTRNDGASRTYVVSRWSFVTHLRDFWREVRRLTSKGAILRFSRFLGQTRQEAIMNFLAFLELVKRRRLFARQKALFGDIEFSTTKEVVDQEERGRT
jgi:chromatin segregation and condensation protein Rec8/ScpA/Scc1 (kleisin family)